MKKTNFLKLSLIGLLLLNLSTLSFIILKDNKSDENRKRNKPDQLIINKLEFNTDQENSYKKLIQKHSQQINIIQETILNYKNNLYTKLKNNSNSKTQIDSLISKINEQQKNIELINYNHFLDIKEICSQKQIPAYNELVNELSVIFSNQPRQKE
jgi:protein CpxP